MKLGITADRKPSLDAMWRAYRAAISGIEDESDWARVVTTTYGYDAFGARVYQIVATTSTSTYPFKFFSIASSTETMALQDLGCGNGFALIDPHGDLVARIAARIPAAQRDRVIYLNTTDRAQPYGYNPLRHVAEESRISDGTDASGSGCVGTPLTGVKRHGQRRAEEAR